MSTGKGKISIDLSIGIIGRWKETFRWIPIFGAFLAFANAFATGANSLPVPFSTSVVSGAFTLLQASLMLCIINVPGAALAKNHSVDALFSDFLKENQVSEGFLMWSLVTVLITTIIWLALATYLELPVSSQESMQSALLGTMLVNGGVHFLPVWNMDKNQNFNGVGLIRIILEWTVAPPIAALIAFCFFRFLKITVLRQENAEKRILTFLPIYYGISAGLLCFFLMYQVSGDKLNLRLLPIFLSKKNKDFCINHVIPQIVTIEDWETVLAVTLATLIAALLSLIVVVPLARKRLDGEIFINKKSQSWKHRTTQNQEPCIRPDEEEEKFEDALKDYMEMRVLDTVYEEDERSCASPATLPDSNISMPTSLVVSTPGSLLVSSQSTPFKQLLESTPNRLVQKRNFQKIEKTTGTDNFFKFFRDTISPVDEYDRHTLVRHALAEKFDKKMEDLLGFPHLLAACIFALIQSANEIAAVATPFEAIDDIFQHREKYSGNVEDVILSGSHPSQVVDQIDWGVWSLDGVLSLWMAVDSVFRRKTDICKQF
ncbi:uncharacterized protein LOC143860335 [Tasmannia lanceolata]|uniref:uncharacterized protein LOC143860335 n=1 Tax=Tasmannia lanceolata TaxID=3420 RepID=UPI00406326C3